MEGYDDVENDAFDAYNDATTGAAGGQEHEEPRHNLQMVCHIEEEEEADRNQLVDMGVFKPTSGNATKRLRMRQETRETTRAGKTAEATLKQVATREFQAEKGKMQIWKLLIMEEVAHELQAIKRAHVESVEAQRECFRIEMEEVKEKLEQMEGFRTELEEVTEKLGQMEVKSARVERELDFLKAKEQTLSQQLDKDAPTIKKNQAQPKRQRKSLEKSTELVEEEEIPPTHSPRNTQVPREETQETSEEEIAMSAREEATTIPSQVRSVKPKEPRSYATVAAAKPAQTPTQPWTKVSYGNRKIKSSAATQVEQRGRRILFPRKDGGELKSEADLMLALNESLQKAGVDPKVRFSRVRYAPSGSVSALLLEKADATTLLPQRSNLLSRAAKTVDDAVVGVEILEQWQRLKVHGMSLDRYLGSGKLELLKREVESSTGIVMG